MNNKLICTHFLITSILSLSLSLLKSNGLLLFWFNINFISGPPPHIFIKKFHISSLIYAQLSKYSELMIILFSDNNFKQLSSFNIKC